MAHNGIELLGGFYYIERGISCLGKEIKEGIIESNYDKKTEIISKNNDDIIERGSIKNEF